MACLVRDHRARSGGNQWIIESGQLLALALPRSSDVLEAVEESGGPIGREDRPISQFCMPFAGSPEQQHGDHKAVPDRCQWQRLVIVSAATWGAASLTTDTAAGCIPDLGCLATSLPLAM